LRKYYKQREKLINYENEILLKNLKSYIENNIIPLYSKFDKGHQKDHIEKVWKSSLQILKDNEITDININMVYTIAMFHDIGLSHNRKDHHKYSKKILMNDLYLKEIFSKEEIEIMGDAVEDHRASNKNKARSIYGEIVSDGDRLINLREIILRIFQYEDKYIKLSKDDLFKSCYEHLSEKYGADNHVGYVKLYFNKSNSQKELDKIHKMNKEDIYKECEIVYNEMKGNM